MCNIWSDRYFSGFKILMSHCRAISRDEKRYHNASRFMPERFLDVNGALTDDDPAAYVFGLGRRACPGELIHLTGHIACNPIPSLIRTVCR